MNKKITLQENLKRLQNCLMSVSYLSNPDNYGYYSIDIDRVNKKYLRQTLRNIKRLQYVIQKQLAENSILQAYSVPLEMDMFKQIKNGSINELKFKRDDQFNNKVEVFIDEGKYVGRFLL